MRKSTTRNGTNGKATIRCAIYTRKSSEESRPVVIKDVLSLVRIGGGDRAWRGGAGGDRRGQEDGIGELAGIEILAGVGDADDLAAAEDPLVEDRSFLGGGTHKRLVDPDGILIEPANRPGFLNRFHLPLASTAPRAMP